MQVRGEPATGSHGRLGPLLHLLCLLLLLPPLHFLLAAFCLNPAWKLEKCGQQGWLLGPLRMAEMVQVVQP